MIIYGYRTIVRQLAMITLVCARCNSYAPQQFNRRLKKFTLFFIPLFPISSWYFSRCTACGHDHTIRKAAMEQIFARQTAPAPTCGQVPQQNYGQVAPQNYGQPYPNPQYAGQPYPVQQYPGPTTNGAYQS